jgi:hypothetical protein
MSHQAVAVWMVAAGVPNPSHTYTVVTIKLQNGVPLVLCCLPQVAWQVWLLMMPLTLCGWFRRRRLVPTPLSAAVAATSFFASLLIRHTAAPAAFVAAFGAAAVGMATFASSIGVASTAV